MAHTEVWLADWEVGAVAASGYTPAFRL